MSCDSKDWQDLELLSLHFCVRRLALSISSMRRCFAAVVLCASTFCAGALRSSDGPAIENNAVMTDMIPRYYHSSAQILEYFHQLANGGCQGGTSVVLDKHGDLPSITTAIFKRGTGVKKKVFFLFGEHARELISPETAMQMAKDLCMLDPATRSVAETVLSHSEVFMVPIANPLGRLSVEKGNTCQRVNENGVDLNRNWASHWEEDEGSIGSDTYPGKSSFSEVETRTLKTMVEAYKPSMFVTVHSGTLGMYTPYAYSTDVPHDDPNDLNNMVRIIDKLNPTYCQCPSGPAGKEVGYLCPGTCLDFAYDEVKTKYSFAFEIFASDADSIHETYRQSKKTALLEVGRLRVHKPHVHEPHRHNSHEYSCFLQTAVESSASLMNKLSPSECVGYFNPTTKEEYEQTKTKWAEAFLKMIDMAHGAQEAVGTSKASLEQIVSPAKHAISSLLRANANNAPPRSRV